MRASAVVAQDQLASLQSADDFARYMREHGVLDGEVSTPTARHGIPHGIVSRTAQWRGAQPCDSAHVWVARGTGAVPRRRRVAEDRCAGGLRQVLTG